MLEVCVLSIRFLYLIDHFLAWLHQYPIFRIYSTLAHVLRSVLAYLTEYDFGPAAHVGAKQ